METAAPPPPLIFPTLQYSGKTSSALDYRAATILLVFVGWVFFFWGGGCLSGVSVRVAYSATILL